MATPPQNNHSMAPPPRPRKKRKSVNDPQDPSSSVEWESRSETTLEPPSPPDRAHILSMGSPSREGAMSLSATGGAIIYIGKSP